MCVLEWGSIGAAIAVGVADRRAVPMAVCAVVHAPAVATFLRAWIVLQLMLTGGLCPWLCVVGGRDLVGRCSRKRSYVPTYLHGIQNIMCL